MTGREVRKIELAEIEYQTCREKCPAEMELCDQSTSSKKIASRWVVPSLVSTSLIQERRMNEKLEEKRREQQQHNEGCN